MTTRPPAPTLVVPCHDEAARLDGERFLTFAQAHPDVRFVLVDDGSTDGTLAVLEGLAARAPGRFEVVALPSNRGKAEAVRQGVLHALRGAPDAVGYWDADLATPLEALPRFVEALAVAPQVEVVLGARVKLLGRHVERRAARHYVGRVAATAASALLALPVYDTQCGAKLLRVTPGTRALFEAPFSTRWAFDVELLARWLAARPDLPRDEVGRFVVELPLERWEDVAGSKLRARDVLGAPLELWRIWRRYGAALR